METHLDYFHVLYTYIRVLCSGSYPHTGRIEWTRVSNRREIISSIKRGRATRGLTWETVKKRGEEGE